MDTRVVTVDRVYDFPLRQGGMRFEAWCKPQDDRQPNYIVATTFDPFTADLLGLARRHHETVWLTVDAGSYGFDIVRAERTAA